MGEDSRRWSGKTDSGMVESDMGGDWAGFVLVSSLGSDSNVFRVETGLLGARLGVGQLTWWAWFCGLSNKPVIPKLVLFKLTTCCEEWVPNATLERLWMPTF